MRACITSLLQLVFLTILVGVVPPALASAAEAPTATNHEAIVDAPAHAVHADAANVVHGAAVTTGHEVAAEDGHGEAHGGGSLAPAKLKDLFWRVVNFLALVIILVKFGAKPIITGLRGRQQQVKEDLETLTLRRDEAEQSYKDFEVKLAGMEKEMDQVVAKAISQAQIEKERILADAEKAAEDIKRQAEAAIQAQLEDAKRILREEMADQAAAMAEELIVKNLTPADQVAITEQYLERVGAVQ